VPWPPRPSSSEPSPRLAENGRYTSPLAAELADDVLDRFLRYVRIDTQSDYDSQTSPSTAKQRDLGELLRGELEQLGLADVRLDDHGLVSATLSGTRGPTIGLIAHMDTSPDESGAGVQPQVVRYEGGDITLPGDPRQAIRPTESALLAHRVGHDIVTTDGTTLLGADDKAGIAEIMTAVAYLSRHPELEHAPIRIGFTVDEEVGRGVEHFDIAAFGADFAYTFDGTEPGKIDDENFTASEVRIRIDGHSVHPGSSKGKLVNSVKLAARLIERLPRDGLSPETTEEREGFVHPARVTGTASHSTITFIVRDFDSAKVREYEELLRGLGAGIERDEPRARVRVEVEESYVNMKELLDERPRILEAADEATRRAGLEPTRNAIRGGTDGAMLTARGLPTPNVFTGGQEYHSVLEWISVQDMATSAATAVELAKLWAEEEWADSA
jgi:tripeptide aminopeptidase